MNRTERQTIGLRKWAAFQYQGIAEYPTGFGKTYTAIRAIKGMITRKGIKDVMVVVPTITLKEQWEAELKKHGITIAEVYVINTMIKDIRKTDLLILDEVHRYAAETFKLVFAQTTYNFILALTATLEREDGLHDIILEYIQIFDSISVQEALQNGWISPFHVYNIAIPFSKEEAEEYKKINNSFRHFAAQLGAYGPAFKVAQQWLSSDSPSEKGKAIAYFKCMRNRKALCLNNSNKAQAVKAIVETLSDRNGLIFSATTEFADNLQNMLGDIAMTFHSKLGKRAQEQVIKRFKDKRTKVRMLSTCKALNEGFDVPDCSLGIIAGSNSTKLTFIQQLGRVVRYVEDKKAIVINLYTPDTQEVKWMEKRMDSIKSDMITNCSLVEFINLFSNEEESKAA